MRGAGGLGAWLVAGAAFGPSARAASPAPSASAGPVEPVARPPDRSRVVVVRDTRLERSGLACNRKVLEARLDEGMLLLTGEKTVEAAWRKYFSADEKVAIKINGVSAPNLGTTPDLVRLAVERLVGIGVKAERIVVFEMRDYTLTRSGFTLSRAANATRYQCIEGDYGEPTSFGQFHGRFGRVVEEADAILNLPVLKDHARAGITGALKAFYGAIDNPSQYHTGCCDPYIAQVNAHPTIRKKSRLVVFDSIRAVYNGGPAFKEAFAFAPAELYFSADPVAVDAHAAAVIDRKRVEMKLPTMAAAGRPARHIRTAALYGLGNDDPARIETIRKEHG